MPITNTPTSRIMQTVALALIFATGAVAQFKNHPEGKTLRDWIMNTNCLNLASQPLMNTQFAQLGALDALSDAGLMDKVTGLAGVSSGAFVMALAATQNFSHNSQRFRQIWPGWSKMIPAGVVKKQ